MFRCDHCQREFGGIRGVSADRCPRCATEARAAQQRPAPMTTTAAVSWRPLQPAGR